MNKIKELRLKNKKSLRDVASVLNTSNQNISNWERDTRKGYPKISIETWKKLADYFNVSIPYIMGIDEDIDKANKQGMANSTKQLLEMKKITPKELGEMFTPVVDEDTVNSWLLGEKYDADKDSIIDEMLKIEYKNKEGIEHNIIMYQQELDYFTEFYNDLLENEKFSELSRISTVLDMIQKAYK